MSRRRIGEHFVVDGGGSVGRQVMRGFDRDAFRAARKARGMPVSELARISGVSMPTIHRWEHGSSSPQVDNLVKVLEVLEVPISEVVRVPASERMLGDWRVLAGLLQPSSPRCLESRQPASLI